MHGPEPPAHGRHVGTQPAGLTIHVPLVRQAQTTMVSSSGDLERPMSEERFDRVDKRLDGLGADVQVLQADVAVLKTDVAELKTDVRDLRRHMGVLHEEVLDRIQGIGEDDSLRREMRAGFAELRQIFLDHTIPGDAADRQFGVTLADHETRISTLELGLPSESPKI